MFYIEFILSALEGLLVVFKLFYSYFFQLEQAFKIMFADLGDEMSRQYTGTGAMKSGFTRYGNYINL